MKKLPAEFYKRKDVTKIARELLGKIIVTNFDEIHTSGRIVETEAYNGVIDKASHAYSGRRTKRTEVMFGDGGYAYVYLCYGIHHLFNVVTNVADVPHAVLVRAIEPVAGVEFMLARMNKSRSDHTIGRGPGNVSRSLGISTAHTGRSLLGDEIFIADDGERIPASQIVATRRVGVDYAAEDALLPYRYYIAGVKAVSKK